MKTTIKTAGKAFTLTVLKTFAVFVKFRKLHRTSALVTLLVLSAATPRIWAEINEWTRLGWPEGGSVGFLVIDPQNPNTVYATGSWYATNFGVGIFKSTNGGTNWRAINFGLITTGVSSLAMTPKNPST